ncbi:MAG: alpha/beta hydrolase-fold protein [Longicatena sp.]
MKTEYFKEFSHELNRDMEFKVYGEKGIPCLVFPAQDGRFYDFENFGMIDAAHEYIDAGSIQFICCDSIDSETWSNEDGNPRERLELHERWYHYIVDELAPRIHEINKKGNSKAADGIMTCGVSMGALHALNFLLRRPDIFHKVLGLSGIYHADFFFHDYHDELTYQNSPADYLPNMQENHPYLELYKTAEIVLCCGQGAWEQEMEYSLRQMDAIFQEKHIDVWIDEWGFDVSHDWYWWKKQLDYFLQFMV